MKPEDVEVNMTLNQFKPYYLTIPDELVALQKIRSSVLNKNTNFIETTHTNHNDLGARCSGRGRSCSRRRTSSHLGRTRAPMLVTTQRTIRKGFKTSWILICWGEEIRG